METDIGAPHSQPESSFLRLGKESGHQTGVCNIQLTDLCEHHRHKNRSSNIGRKIKEGHNHSLNSTCILALLLPISSLTRSTSSTISSTHLASRSPRSTTTSGGAPPGCTCQMLFRLRTLAPLTTLTTLAPREVLLTRNGRTQRPSLIEASPHSGLQYEASEG